MPMAAMLARTAFCGMPKDGSTTSCTTLLFDDFESGYGNWNDGGSDCTLSNSTSFAYNSSYSLRLRDNSSSSVATTDSFDASEYDELSVSFWYITSSFESGEDFWLRISTNGGSSYTTVETWAQGTDFSNNVHYNPTVTTDIEVTVSVDDKVTVSLVDNGGTEFDVTVKRDVDTDSPLEERKPGGLGVHLVQNLVDTLEYEYQDGRGEVIFTKGSGT